MTDAIINTYALVGHPNSGKTTLFNLLTGAQQRTGNFPGVTTDIFQGDVDTEIGRVSVIDLPGAYSLYPNTEDERQLVHLLLSSEEVPFDGLIYVADATMIDSQLLLLTQLMDLGYAVRIFLTHMDAIPSERHASVFRDLEGFSGMSVLGADLSRATPEVLRKELLHDISKCKVRSAPCRTLSAAEKEVVGAQGQPYHSSQYLSLLRWHHQGPDLHGVDEGEIKKQRVALQIQETLERYDMIHHELDLSVFELHEDTGKTTRRLDRVLTHPVWGSLFFFGALLLVFQAIFSWSSWPMDQIDAAVAWAQQGIKSLLGDHTAVDFLADGVLSGVGGVVIFIPQIAILFLLIGIMEASGYMARAVYLFDSIMRKFGMSGRSLVSLMSAGACAIPAVMSARTIASPKERLITMLVAPFISCSARIPVYTVLIGLAVPATTIAGLFNLQGLVFMGLYILSALVALLSGFVLRKVLRQAPSSPLILQLPDYQWPRLRPLLRLVWTRTRAFVVEAGKVILILSMVLWLLSNYGPSESMQAAESAVMTKAETENWSAERTDAELASAKMSASYAGQIGQAIAPVIKPLGYDWKIGIGLIAAFAAREVFVGAIATLYSLDGTTDDTPLLRERLRQARHEDSGAPVFTLATAASLLVFFLLAMQCMSTLAVVRQETRSWKWPLLQFGVMLIMAYTASFAVYQILS